MNTPEEMGRVPAPTGWESIKFTHAVRIPTGLVDPEDDEFADLRLIAPNHIEAQTGRITGSATADDQGASSGKFLVEKGELIYSKIRPALNKVCIAPERCLCSADMYPLRPDPALLDPRFLFYLILSPFFLQKAVDESMRVAMPKVNRESLGAIRIPVPPRPTQRAIADFLDRETEKIDTLIEKKERLLELLDEKRTALITQAVTKGLDPDVPMKDSGVEWLGEVPEHWEVVRLKTVANVWPSNVDKHSREGEVPVRLCNYTDVYYGDRIEESEDLMEATASRAEIAKFGLRAGDVIITKDSESADDIAVPAFVPNDLPGVVCGYHLDLVRPRSDKLSGRYLYYHLLGQRGSDQFMLAANGVTRFGLSVSDVADAWIPLPPTQEQERIASRLDEETNLRNEVAARAKSAIDLLREYRTALISAAVTGQIDVTDEAVT